MTNIVLLVGNVGQDPTTRTTQSGTAITAISLATSRKYRNASEELVEETEWHRITCFNGTAKNVAAYVRKGAKISVQGRLHYTRWTDGEGVERYGCEIVADEVNFLSKAPPTKPETEDAPARKPGRGGKKPAAAEPDLVGDLDDDVPF